MAQSGDKCPRQDCAGRLRARTSKRVGESYVRRLECNQCGANGGKEVVEAVRIRDRGQRA